MAVAVAGEARAGLSCAAGAAPSVAPARQPCPLRPLCAGGPMVAPSVPCTLITPVAPHSLSFRCAHLPPRQLRPVELHPCCLQAACCHQLKAWIIIRRVNPLPPFSSFLCPPPCRPVVVGEHSVIEVHLPQSSRSHARSAAAARRLCSRTAGPRWGHSGWRPALCRCQCNHAHTHACSTLRCPQRSPPSSHPPPPSCRASFDGRHTMRMLRDSSIVCRTSLHALPMINMVRGGESA